MKTILSLLFCFLLFSCNNNEDKKSNSATSNEDTATTTASSKEVATKDGTLKQQGDYSSLFEREPGNCDFITAEGLTKALGISLDVIAKEESNCAYNLTEANGNETRFHFRVEAWKNKTVIKEIKSAKDNAETFGKDSKLSQYRISETGDTYLSMHQNRMIRILNEQNKNTIIVFYSINTPPTATGIEKRSEEKDIALERSYAIANYILNTHKK